jgi:hypothetical protein
MSRKKRHPYTMYLLFFPYDLLIPKAKRFLIPKAPLHFSRRLSSLAPHSASGTLARKTQKRPVAFYGIPPCFLL